MDFHLTAQKQPVLNQMKHQIVTKNNKTDFF